MNTTEISLLQQLELLQWAVVANAGNLPGLRILPRWVHVMNATGFGSEKSRELCRKTGFDPDERIGHKE